MAIRNILQLGDETLRKKSFEVTAFDQKLHELLDQIFITSDKYKTRNVLVSMEVNSNNLT